jgi:hypothetical protein
MSGVVKQSNIRTVLHEILKPITSKMAIATSGGIDSASLVMAAQDLGKKQIIVSFTFDDFESHDFKIDTLVTGLAADGHFGLSKKAMIHYSKDDKKFKQLRQEYFSTYESAHIVRLQQLCNNNQILLQNPYFSPLVFDLWIDKNWQELNKPRQKEAIKKYFPELDKFKIKPHTNLQLGDSKIAQRVGSAVVSKYKPYAKSPVGIYMQTNL